MKRRVELESSVVVNLVLCRGESVRSFCWSCVQHGDQTERLLCLLRLSAISVGPPSRARGSCRRGDASRVTLCVF